MGCPTAAAPRHDVRYLRRLTVRPRPVAATVRAQPLAGSTTDGQWLEDSADLVGDGDDWALAGGDGVVDVHVHEAALGGCLVAVALEEPDAVDDRRPSQPLHREPELDGGGEPDLLVVAARHLG